MTCREVIELLGDLAANDVAPERRRQAEEHLAGCPACLAYRESYQRTIELARRLQPAAVPPALLQQLRGLLDADPKAGDTP